MILAGIDIGTNTLRLLIASVHPDSFREIASSRIITRLGEGLDRTGSLSPEAQERSLRALQDFSDIIAMHEVAAVSAAGTSALRNAANGGEFVAAARARTGLNIRIIGGAEEARCALLGVRRAIAAGAGGADPLASALVVDIGGGSTELIATQQGVIADMESIGLGAVYLTERYVRHDPPEDGELSSLRDDVARQLDAWEGGLARRQGLAPRSFAVLAGTAGTITTLAAMDRKLERYDPERINGHVLTRRTLDGMVDSLAALPLARRRTLVGLETGREDIILAGAIVCQEIMERCGKDNLLVSDWGLREGIILDLFERQRGEQP